MFVRVTRGRFDPAKSDDLARLFPAINAAVRGLPGCQGYQGGLDRDGGKTVALSTFDTLEHARFSRDAIGAALAPVIALGVQLDPAEIYEVLD